MEFLNLRNALQTIDAEVVLLQVAATTKKTPNSRIPNYLSLSSQLLCQVHNITLHADKETDEIYPQMTLQPVCK
uniref:Uncharacterized protein n=1 Tax=Arundo donax TaxID=35708 RepID=A0A0A9CER0_ARUDO